MSIFQVKRKVPASAPNREGPPGSVQRSRRRDWLADFAQDTAGDVAILFGLMAMAMFMLIGAAVDFGRWLNARDNTLAAIDSAVLAGGRALQSPDPTLGISAEQQAKNMAKRYYDDAVKYRLKVDGNVVFKIEASGTVVTIENTNISIKTPFLRFAGIPNLPILKASGVENPKAVLAVGGNAELNLEISMMLDVSGSMGSGTKLEDMQAAATDLVDIVVWSDQSLYTSKVAIVPFSGDVRPPASMLSLVTDPTWPATRTYNTRTYGMTACVGERTGSDKYTDALPVAGAFPMNTYTRQSSGSKCSTPSTGEVRPLNNNKTTITNQINALTLGGGTAGHLGTAWAYYMLSPNWSTRLTGISTPVSYTAPKTKKIAVLMTDGEYNYTFDSNGIATDTTGGNANSKSSAEQALSLCTEMKGDNIEVYTVGFEVDGNATAISTLTNCATDASHFYKASDGEQLKAAFRDIALKISTLHLKQ
jgi:Flp pilus assembly protein TadG